jgi:deazaflavin-dependent oxidoreductase (nitroreductase family)
MLTTHIRMRIGWANSNGRSKGVSSGISGLLRTVVHNISNLSQDVIDAAKTEREVTFTTFGRKTGQPYEVTIFIVTDGHRLFIVSGQGMARQWPQNLAARGDAVLHFGGFNVHVKSRHVIDPGETRMISGLYGSKYGPRFAPPQPGEPPRLSEQATFELIPAGS